MKKFVVIMALLVVSLSCAREDKSDRVEAELQDSIDRTNAAPVDTNYPPTPSLDLATAEQLADSLDRMLRRVPALSRTEQRKLRRDVNAKQIARAKQLGIPMGAPVGVLVARRQLVELPANTRYWSLHRFDYSSPYVTPSTANLLAEIGERFHAKLDSIHAPPLRLVITSALRTPEKQALLRLRNRNASRIESAHEFGTTVDIAYRRYTGMGTDVLSDSIMARAANRRSAELQALLGRVLQEMSDEGKLMVMMERRQTVFHLTVARQISPHTTRVSRPSCVVTIKACQSSNRYERTDSEVSGRRAGS